MGLRNGVEKHASCPKKLSNELDWSFQEIISIARIWRCKLASYHPHVKTSLLDVETAAEYSAPQYMESILVSSSA